MKELGWRESKHRNDASCWTRKRPKIDMRVKWK